jgi:hypothetical protein
MPPSLLLDFSSDFKWFSALEVIVLIIQTNIAVVPIKSGMATFFVAMAEDPQAFYENFPDLYQVIVQTYPQLAHGVPRGEV